MGTRPARHPEDDADLVLAWNSTAKFAGLCIVGDKTRYVSEVDNLFRGQSVMVHENSRGEIDGAMSYRWERHREPYFGTGLIIPSRMEQSTPMVQGALVLAIFQFFHGKGFETSRLETPPKVMMLLPFIGQLGGDVLHTPKTGDDLATSYHYRFNNAVAIERMEEFLSQGFITIVR